METLEDYKQKQRDYCKKSYKNKIIKYKTIEKNYNELKHSNAILSQKYLFLQL